MLEGKNMTKNEIDYDMKSILSSEYAHLLWKDELGDDFLLLKYAEVYRYSENILRLHCWSKLALNNLKKICSIFNEWATDDAIYSADINISDFAQVIQAWAPKKRFAKNSKWLKDKEQRLAHKIIPYKPKIKEQ